MFTLKKSLQITPRLLPIDFTKPWWQIVVNQKRLATAIAMLTMAPHIFWSISPFLITYVFEWISLSACLVIFTIWFIINISEALGYRLNAQFQLQIIHSIHQNAHQQLLVIDPRYHTHRSSGAILGKIDRAARGYEDLLDQLLLEFSPILVGLVTTIAALAYYSLWLMVIVTCLFAAIIISGYYFATKISTPREKKFISSDDAFRATAVENLAQVQLVRATFASDHMSDKLTANIKNNMQNEGSLWISYTYANLLLRTIYLIALFVVVVVLLWQINAGSTTIVSATALAIAYLRNTQLLLRIIGPFRRYMRGLNAVRDLFAFIPSFDKQTYPVLGRSDMPIIISEAITIKADGISFDYETAKLFNDHSLLLSCDQLEDNKLYGIIGASGSGKTTLLSILGGQLKPDVGCVLINNIDIYNVTESARRRLIAMQGQIASTIQGSVKYNLLFGLPEDHGYSDDNLFAILDRVGLLSVLNANQGLLTELGERGLNLSGGQRQRVNFVSLYLRAKYFRPPVILIDEPTSSLDEISESFITDMISELARHSLTLVIAHRLKTVENAVGLIDLSLLSQEKNIAAYSLPELEQRSAYYRQLASGKIRLDS